MAVAQNNLLLNQIRTQTAGTFDLRSQSLYIAHRRIIRLKSAGFITQGQYLQSDSFIHTLDSRVKLALALILSIASLMTESNSFNLILIIGLVFCLIRFTGGWPVLRGMLKPILIMVIITSAYHIIFVRGTGSGSYDLFGLQISQDAIDGAIFYSGRLVMYMLMMTVLMKSTNATEIGDAILFFLKPFRLIKLPVDHIGLMLFIAVRYISVLGDELSSIRAAQLVRGMRFDGNLITRTRKSISLVAPLFSSTLARADRLAVAIKGRGWGNDISRTSYRIDSIGLSDLIVLIGGSSLVVSLLLFGDKL